jgi:hypothetical protein
LLWIPAPVFAGVTFLRWHDVGVTAMAWGALA